MNKLVAALVGVALLALLVRASTFSVSEREYALVFAFGQLKEVKSEPGLYFKLPPPFQNVVYLDRRILTKRYGKAFIESLPDCKLKVGPMADIPAAAARWLNL